MTDDDALKEYATALLRFLTYFDGPERAKDPDCLTQRWS